MLAASTEIKEMFQRYMIQYHMGHSFYSDPGHNLVGFHVENHIYGTMYYGFDPRYQDRVFAHEERELMREAPHTVLVLLRASKETIAKRMKDDPHPYQAVQEGDIETVLEPNMVVSMEPMIMLPEGLPGAGGYREHDILVVTEDGAENITGFPFGPEHNIIKV